MKFKNWVIILFSIASILTLNQCSKDDAGDSVVLALSVTDIGEQDFKVNWTSGESLSKTEIELSLSAEFNELVYQYTENDPNVITHMVEGLTGATKYYLRVRASLADGTTLPVVTKTVETSYASESVTILTTDGLELSGKLKYLESNSGPAPAIIFMHELGVWVNNWKAADVVPRLIAEGYVCLVFDFRGHGNSTSIPDVGILIEDWSLVATDLKSAMNFLKQDPRVDPTQFALAGGSLGAIMALAGNGYEEVKSSVALSPGKMGVFQIFPDQVLQNTLYIVGENDIHENPSINFPEHAEYLFGISESPKKLHIVNGSGSHGTDLLESKGVEDMILDWIKTGFTK